MDRNLALRVEIDRLRSENERLRRLLAQYGVKFEDKDGKIEKR